MELIVRAGEREETVRVEQKGDLVHVTVGERVHVVDAARVRDDLWSLVVDGAQHEVAVAALRAPRGEASYLVTGRAGATTVSVADPLAHMARAAREAASGGARTVTAYMPGRVVAVLAAPGDTVAPGQGVVVLEAMKMENEIAAEEAGVVTEIHVEPGQSVDGGDPLFELGPVGE